MSNVLKKLTHFGAVAALCLSLVHAVPAGATSDNPRTEITSNLWYNTISPTEYAFSTQEGCFLVIEHFGNTIGNTIFNFYPESGATNDAMLDNAWRNFEGSRNTAVNAAYLQYAMRNMESAYLYEVSGHCRLILKDVADGVGAKPNHFEKFDIYNIVNEVGMLAATATVDNTKGVEMNIIGGAAWIKGTEVRVREQPNTDCAVLGYFDNREEIDVLGYVKSDASVPNPGDWAYVKRANGQMGYVAAQFVAKGDVVENFEAYLRDHIRNSGKYNSWSGINYKFMVIDSYCGEGPKAKATQVIKVYEDMGTHTATMATFHVCSDGRIMKYDVVSDSLQQDN